MLEHLAWNTKCLWVINTLERHERRDQCANPRHGAPVSRAIFAYMTILFLTALFGPAHALADDEPPHVSSVPPRAASVVAEIERMYLGVLRSLDESRRAGRAEHARCIDRTLSRLSGTLRLARERLERVGRHERRGDTTMVERERSLVTRLLPRARELVHEAHRCAEPDLPPNRTRVTVIIDPNVPEDAVVEPRRTDLGGAVHE